MEVFFSKFNSPLKFLKTYTNKVLPFISYTLSEIDGLLIYPLASIRGAQIGNFVCFSGTLTYKKGFGCALSQYG